MWVNVVQTALKNLEISVDEINSKEGIIKASHPGNILSWGNHIEIKITKEENKIIKLTILSSSEAQLISWGTNTEIENNIINEVTKIIGV